MTAELDRAYAVLEHARTCLPDRLPPQAIADLDRTAAAARDALAAYGVDLTVPAHLDVAVAIVDLLTAGASLSPQEFTHRLLATLGRLQQAVIQNVHHRATDPTPGGP